MDELTHEQRQDVYDLCGKLKVMAALPGETEPREVELIATAFGHLSVCELNEIAFWRQRKLLQAKYDPFKISGWDL